MTYDIDCKKDCIYYKNGMCGLKIIPVNSIFSDEDKPCVYYSRVPKVPVRIPPAPSFS